MFRLGLFLGFIGHEINEYLVGVPLVLVLNAQLKIFIIP